MFIRPYIYDHVIYDCTGQEEDECCNIVFYLCYIFHKYSYGIINIRVYILHTLS